MNNYVNNYKEQVIAVDRRFFLPMQELLIVGLYIYILSNLAQYLVIMFLLFWVFIFILDLTQENLYNLFQGYVCCKHAQKVTSM